MFANCTKGYMNFAMPDVCLTPTPAGAPAPMPYPNKSKGTMDLPSSVVLKVMFAGKPAHNIKSTCPLSPPPHAGINGGVKSKKIINSTKHNRGSKKVFVGGKPVTKLGDPTKQNSGNAFGVTIKPAQTKIMVSG